MSEYASLFYVKQITPYFSGLKPYFMFLTILLIWVDLCVAALRYQTDMSGSVHWTYLCVGGLCWWFTGYF